MALSSSCQTAYRRFPRHAGYFKIAPARSRYPAASARAPPTLRASIFIEPLYGLHGTSGVDDRGLRKRRAAYAGDQFEALAQVRSKSRSGRDARPGVRSL